MASVDGNTDTTNDGNTGDVVRDNYCCYPCFTTLQDGSTFTECGPSGFNADNLYSDDGNINVPNQIINGDYYYDKNGTPDNCIMREIGCKKHILGCTSPEASNYNESATKNDGSCIFTETYIQTVCGDESAINYVEPNGTTKIACPNNTCCQYEVEQSDPVGCGCETDKLILQSEIETIDYEIEVLTQQREEIIEENNNSFVPDTNSGYNSYIPYSNINADIQTENTNVIFEDVTNEGVYRKYTSTNITGDIETDFNSLSGNPDLSDSSRWVPIIDGNGIVSFTLNDVDDVEYDTLILSHNTQEKAGANLYKQFCTSKGYVFSTFYIDTQTGKQIQIIPNRDNANQTNNGLTQKCVDPSYILCDDVADIKMVFGSNQWSGFNLPEDNGDTDVEISMDVMVRFNADTLLNDCLVSTCGEPLININGIYDTECQNYIVFADNSDTRELFSRSKNNSYITDSETGQRKWIYGSESISLWQTPGLQNEPSAECCEAFGGEIVKSQPYLNDGKTLNLKEFDKNFSVDQKNHIETLDKIKNFYDVYGKESVSCGNLSYSVYQYKGCESNYADLITTENICSITPPKVCLIYSILLQEYETIIKQLNINIRETSICANEYDQTQKLINDLDSKIIEQQTYINQSEAEKKTLELQQTSFYLRKTLQIQELESQKEDEERKLESPNISDNEKIIIRSTIEDLDRQIKDLEEERKQDSRNDNTTIENIELEISQREDCITEFKILRSRLKKENSQKSCCKSLLERFTNLNSLAVEESSIINNKTNVCYGVWQKTIYNDYNEWLSSQSINVLQFMEDTSINLTLEVDNSLGTIQNNRVTKYTTLDSYTTDINPVWEFDPTGGYTGVLLEGSESSINIVKDSVNEELIERGESASNDIFDEQWQKVRFVLNDTQCALLRDLYPNKQFFIGLSINNERNCETTLLVDNIQINTDINFLQKEYSTDNCLSFDLSCVIDDKKSWVFTDGLVKTAYENQDIRCNPLPTDKKTLTFPKPQERYSGNLEYRYTDYSVNHSKLVLNSKETSFRIDPANAIECDVYNFWQEIDCDDCNTLFSCTTATTLTYTNPTGGTLPLSGTPVPEYSNGIIYDKYNEGGSGFSDRIQNILLQPDGKLIVLASSSSPEYNGTQFGGIIRLNADGSVDNTFNSGTGFNNGAREAVLLSNGKIVVIHRSSTYDGTPIGSVNRFNSDGTLDSTFNVANASFNGNGLHISVQSDGKYIVSGNFIQYGGVSVPDGMIRLNLDGTWDNTFNTGGSGFGPSGFDTDIYVLSDDTIIAAGSTTTYNGNPIPRMVKLDSNGSEVGSFTTNIGTGFNSTVSNVLILSSGKLIVSGAFTDFNGNTVGKIVRLNSDGTYDGTFNSGTGFDDTVSYVIEQLDGKLITGGRFTQFNGSDVPDGLIRLNSDGSIDSTFNSGGYGLGPDITPGGSNNFIKGMILLDNNDIIVAGGYWDTYNGTDVPNNLIRLTAPGKNNSFDSNDILNDIKVLYGKEWLRKLDIELNDYTLAKNMSFSVMNNTKDKDKGSQKVSNESYVNEKFKEQNTNRYNVSYFLPKSLGVGFDIQKSDCNSDIIEIKKYNEDVYTLISEETDGTLGFYSYSVDTNDIFELTSFVDEECCNNVSKSLNDTFKINKPNYGWEDGTCRWKKADSIEDSCDTDCSYYGTQVEETKFIYSGSSGVTLSSTCVDTPVCIKPLDYLDKQPNEVNIKPNFDTMVLSNLIDVKSRQVISDYPMLRLFYNQYLNANGCGASITNRLDYNTTFEVMDLIGDYWTDIIEQVVPATTIWDGHNNSGKVYRNTIFDQNKFPYKRYVLNYYDGDCEINEITRDAIAINTGSTINLTESCLRGECFGSDLKECTEEQKAKQKALQEQIKALEDAIDSLENSDNGNKETILELQRALLKELESDLAKQKEECEDIEETASENQSASSELNNCDDIAKQLNEEEEELKNIIPVGTLSYLKKKAFVDTLRIRYESCKRKSNINITQYNTMFITQMYDSNEYEGDVNVFGDPDWDSDVELLHACGSMEYICPEKPSSENRTITVNGKMLDRLVLVDDNGEDISNVECCQILIGIPITDDNGDKYCLVPTNYQ